MSDKIEEAKPEDVTTSPKKANAKKDEPKPESAGTREHFEELAQTSRKNLQNGGETVKINLIKTVNVRFTKDFGIIKKGHEQLLSQAAYDIYKKKEVVELIG